MTVSSIEVIANAVAGGGTGTPTITTSLLPTDRVVVLVGKGGISGAPTISGLGATWATDAINTTTYDFNVFSAAGITGGGALSLGGFGNAGDYVVHVLRSSVGTTPYLVSAQALAFGAVSGGTVRALTGAPATTGAIVLGLGRVSAGTISLPQASTVPSTGWSTDYTAGTNVKGISQTLAADASVSLALTSSGGFTSGLAQAVYYDDDTGPDPLASTFIGWGLDAGIA